MGNDPTTFSRVLGEIFWKNDFFGSRCYLFWALFFNFKGSGPQGRREFLPEKAQSRTWPSCSGLSQVTCFLDFPLNLLSPLSWWWIRKTDQPFSPLDYKYLNTSVESFNMLYHAHIVYIFSCWPGRNSFIWFPPLAVRRWRKWELGWNLFVGQVLDLKDWSQSLFTCKYFSTLPCTVADILPLLWVLNRIFQKWK